MQDRVIAEARACSSAPCRGFIRLAKAVRLHQARGDDGTRTRDLRRDRPECVQPFSSSCVFCQQVRETCPDLRCHGVPCPRILYWLTTAQEVWLKTFFFRRQRPRRSKRKSAPRCKIRGSALCSFCIVTFSCTNLGSLARAYAPESPNDFSLC